MRPHAIADFAARIRAMRSQHDGLLSRGVAFAREGRAIPRVLADEIADSAGRIRAHEAVLAGLVADAGKAGGR